MAKTALTLLNNNPPIFRARNRLFGVQLKGVLLDFLYGFLFVQFLYLLFGCPTATGNLVTSGV